jgi:hypothetical protein
MVTRKRRETNAGRHASGGASLRVEEMGLVRKSIRLSEHAKRQLEYRGATEDEVFDTIRSEQWGSVELGRLDCRKNYSFNAEWNGKHYSTRQVRPIFVDEPEEIVVVTVYVYYF